VNIAFVFILVIKRSITYIRFYNILVKNIITYLYIKKICKPFIAFVIPNYVYKIVIPN
jgi:hypothetical protein